MVSLRDFGMAGKTELVLKIFIINTANTNTITDRCKPKEMCLSNEQLNLKNAYLHKYK